MTRLIGPANPFIQTDVDVAFDADLSAPAESWDWTTLGDYTDGPHTRPRVLDQTIEVFHGRRDESALADPSTIEVDLGNGDGALTPRNPASPYYPGLKRGTPLRVMVTAGLPYLLLTGANGGRASTPDAASLDITTDLWMAVEFLGPIRFPVEGRYQVFAKYSSATNQRSYYLAVTPAGLVVLFWSTDGTTVPPAATSVLPVPNPEAGPISIGVHLDVNNGAGGHTARFWAYRGTIAELRAALTADETLYRLGDPYVGSGTTSIHSGTAPLEIGDITGTGDDPYVGGIRRAELRAGDWTGTVAANPDFTAQTTSSFVDTAAVPKTWTVNAPATVMTRHPRFTGRVDKVTAGWETVDEANPLMPTIATVKVSASGILERLAQGDSIGSALRRFIESKIASGGVPAAWMFEDGRDATQAAQLVSGARPMPIRGTYSFGGDSSYPAVEQQLTIGSGDVAYMSAPVPQIPQVVGVNWQFTRFFRLDDPATAPATQQLLAVDTNGTVATWRIAINDTQIVITGSDIDGGGVVLDTITSDPTWFDTETMLQLRIQDSGANVAWSVRLILIPAGTLFTTSGSYAGDTGVPSAFRNNCAGPITLGPLIFSTDQDVNWLAPADTAYAGEPAPSRVVRLCQELGIPVAVDGTYVGISTATWSPAILAGAKAMGPQRPGKLLDLLEECAAADFGVLGEQRGSLGLTYRSGVSMQNQSTRLSLVRADRQAVDPFEEVDDDQRFVNDVTATRTEGSSFRIEDPRIAAGTEERYEQSVDVNVRDDLMLEEQAGWRYHLGTWEEPRFPQVWSDVAKDPSIVDDILGFGIGDRFELTDPPPGCPPVDQLSDGIVEELERFQWRVGLNGHPARPWDVAVLEHDERSQPDADGSELAAQFVAGTGTSMSVATTLGDLWTTAAGDFPFHVEVAGVVLNVTNITGGSSPQTFTVTQTAVNGVAKTIPAGEPVRLRHGAVVAP